MGSAFAFIPVSIAALAGVAEHEAGLASGLIYTSQELGGALGIAIASSIAASHYTTLLRGGDSVHAALTGGFHSALWVAGAIALLATPPHPQGRAGNSRGEHRAQEPAARPAARRVTRHSTGAPP
jgi:MFS family permease